MGKGMPVPLPTVLIASPIRYRPECPEVLGEFLVAVERQDYDWGMRRAFFVVQGGHPYAIRPTYEAGDPVELLRHDLVDWSDFSSATFEVVSVPCHADSRALGGPRTTGETQENLAYLRNRILRRFAESDAELLLMIDSDVILRHDALRRMVNGMQRRASDCGGPVTLSLQINNQPFEGSPPVTNAEEFDADGSDPSVLIPTPWSEGVPMGEFREVARSGACTLYPREALARRFYWDPRYREEHQAYFDELRAIGFRHWLLQAPELVEHRMKREPDPRGWLGERKAERKAREAASGKREGSG